MEWMATAAFGLEGLVKKELEQLGFKASAGQGGARFEADPEGAFRANLWLACADRVLMVLGERPVNRFEELFDFVHSLPWGELLPRDAAFPVSGNCVRSQLMSVSDCQRIAKKAIARKLTEKYMQDWLPETGAVYPVSVTLHRDVARVTLDASGDALNKRGYRTWVGEAPLRETLAAALVRLSPWKPGVPLYDPCCGTGTLLIEAAFLASGRAPGLDRRFAMERWAGFSAQAADRLRREARARYRKEEIAGIRGSDLDPEALKLCARHLRQAGLEGLVHVEQKDVREVRLGEKAPCFLTNPPYGERLGDRKKSAQIAAALGRLLAGHPGATLCAITADPAFERQAGRKANSRRRLYNGRIECEFLVLRQDG